MKSPENGGPAFPVCYEHDDAMSEQHGLSKLDYFAALAMQALITANPNHPGFSLGDHATATVTAESIHTLVLRSYTIAEKMVQESSEPD